MLLARTFSRLLAAALCTLAVALFVAAQGGTPTLTVTSPAPGATLPSGIVVIAFAVQNFTLGDPGQTHLHFYVDADPVRYDFYNGASGNPDAGVQYNGLHTHFVHWASPTSVQMFGVAPGAHQVRLVLAAANHSELTNAEATETRHFTVAAPPAGEFTLQSVLTGLSFPLSIAFAPDGRLFFNEWMTGRIRVVQPNFGTVSTFFTVSNLVTGGERGLLGLALDPDFATNHFVYAYYTASGPLRNKIIRLTDANSVGSDETVIVDNLPASPATHVGGVIQFGPAGKLYVVIGDTDDPESAQNTTALSGKILRYNQDGTIPAGNPFGNTPVWAYGIRNSFGFTFHPHTGDLWETENGPASDDEVNRILPGGNYGWPNVTGIANHPLFIDPLVAITPTIAPTGIVAVGENSNYPARYHHNLLFTDFNTGRIRRIVLTGAGLTELGSLSVAFDGGQGALLDIEQAPDGFLYVSSDSGIFRLNVTGDSTAPVLSAVSASGITSAGASITWSSNEGSDTQVEYGTTSAYGSTTTLNSALVTSHSAALSGLTANTLYHFRVKSSDAASNLATSGDFTFTTAPVPGDSTPPTISGVGASGISTTGTTINWTTNEASDTQVEYGETTAYGASSALNIAMVTSHSVTLNGLLAGTLYHYRVKSRDAAGNLADGGNQTFTTLPQSGGAIPSTLGWYEIPNTKLSSVCPPDQFGYDFQFYCGSQGAVTGAWNGGIADSKRNRLIIWGGGGGAYAGNEVYALDLTTLQMKRLNDPSPPISGTADRTSDGKANSRHTYNGLAYIEHLDKMFVFGGSLWKGGQTWSDTWLLDLATLQWEFIAGAGAGPTDHYNSHAQYDPVTQKVLLADRKELWWFDPATKQYTRVGPFTIGLATSSVLDPNRRILFSLGMTWGGSPEFAAIHVDTGQAVNLSLSGCSELISAAAPGNKEGSGPGLAYDPVQDRIVGWVSGNTIFAFNPDTQSCSLQTFPGGPGAPEFQGTYGRFRYFPSLGVFALVNHTNQNAFALRLTPRTGGDLEVPTVTITAPASGATLMGAVMIAAAAADNVGVAGVQFRLNGAALGSEVIVAPYQMTFDTGSVSNGNYQLTARARDASGNLATSAAVPITIDNSDQTPPVITGPTATGITTAEVTIAWTTDEPADSQVEYGTTTAYGSSTTLNPALVTSHNAPLSGLTADTLYHFRVKSRDVAGNLTMSGDFTFTTSSASDTTAPTVTLTAPGSGATVSGTINVTATANDNLSVAGVQFRLDGGNLGAEDTSAPFQVSWSTTSALNGSHTLTAVARDAAGNQTTSAPVTITVANNGGPVTVTLATVADAYVRSNNVNKNYGTSPELRVRLGDASNPITIRSYLKFTLSGLSGTVTAAKLRLWVTDGSTHRGITYAASNAWTETAITWNNAPPPGTMYANGGLAPLGTWVEIDLPASAFAAGNGDSSFVIVGGNTNSAVYSSRQGTSPPQLVLTLAP